MKFCQNDSQWLQIELDPVRKDHHIGFQLPPEEIEKVKKKIVFRKLKYFKNTIQKLTLLNLEQWRFVWRCGNRIEIIIQPKTNLKPAKLVYRKFFVKVTPSVWALPVVFFLLLGGWGGRFCPDGLWQAFVWSLSWLLEDLNVCCLWQKKSTNSACLTEEERGRGIQSYLGSDFYKGAKAWKYHWTVKVGGRMWRALKLMARKMTKIYPQFSKKKSTYTRWPRSIHNLARRNQHTQDDQYISTI